MGQKNPTWREAQPIVDEAIKQWHGLMDDVPGIVFWAKAIADLIAACPYSISETWPEREISPEERTALVALIEKHFGILGPEEQEAHELAPLAKLLGVQFDE